MCGLAGVMGRGITADDINAFEDIFWMSPIRGKDSAGLFTYTPTGQYSKPKFRLKRRIGPSSYFLSCDAKLPDNDRMIRTVYTEVFMGHCRWATIGDVTHENAHPFDTKKFVSAHNGTLIEKRYDDKVKTDSQMLFEDMDERGIEPVLDGLSGKSAYAVTIFDKASKKLYMARNYERTLSIGIVKDRGVVFWASEPDFIRLACKRHKIDVEIYNLRAFKLYEFDLDNIVKGNLTPYTKVELNNPWSIKNSGVWSARTHGPSTVGPTSTWGGTASTGWESDWCDECGVELYGMSLSCARENKTARGSSTFTCTECIIKERNDKHESLGDLDVRVG